VDRPTWYLVYEIRERKRERNKKKSNTVKIYNFSKSIFYLSVIFCFNPFIFYNRLGNGKSWNDKYKTVYQTHRKYIGCISHRIIRTQGCD
jgi:hypothetical protein